MAAWVFSGNECMKYSRVFAKHPELPCDNSEQGKAVIKCFIHTAKYLRHSLVLLLHRKACAEAAESDGIASSTSKFHN